MLVLLFYFTVIILATGGSLIRDFMLAALDLGLINGEYAFFNFRRSDNKLIFGDDTWNIVRH